MPNNYFSKTRQVWARNVASGTMPAPGTDITITTKADPVLFNVHRLETNPNSNIVLKDIGIFSNFADGLVKTSAGYQFVLTVRLLAFELDINADRSGVTGGTSITTVGGTTTVTGLLTSFSSYLSDGDYFYDGVYVYNADTVVSDTAITARDLNPENRTLPLGPTGTVDRILPTVDTSRPILVENLNEWLPIDEFLLSGMVNNPYALGLEVLLRTNRDDIASPNTLIDYHTDSVNAGFTGDDVYIDVGLNYEYTANSL